MDQDKYDSIEVMPKRVMLVAGLLLDVVMQQRNGVEKQESESHATDGCQSVVPDAVLIATQLISKLVHNAANVFSIKIDFHDDDVN